MFCGVYLKTKSKNLKEYNKKLRAENAHIQYLFCGYYQTANGYKERVYQCINESGQELDDPIPIYFNQDEE